MLHHEQVHKFFYKWMRTLMITVGHDIFLEDFHPNIVAYFLYFMFGMFFMSCFYTIATRELLNALAGLAYLCLAWEVYIFSIQFQLQFWFFFFFCKFSFQIFLSFALLFSSFSSKFIPFDTKTKLSGWSIKSSTYIDKIPAQICINDIECVDCSPSTRNTFSKLEWFIFAFIILFVSNVCFHHGKENDCYSWPLFAGHRWNDQNRLRDTFCVSHNFEFMCIYGQHMLWFLFHNDYHERSTYG